MANTVDVKTLFDGTRYKIFHFTNQSDGTAETAVQKVDISAFTDPGGNVATYTAIDRVEFAISGYNYVTLLWDHGTDDEIAVMSGQGLMDWSQLGGNVDPRTAGGTGDILLTTVGPASACAYDITVFARFKA